MRPANTRHWRWVIPRAAAAEMVIYCRGINKTAPSPALSLPPLHLLTRVSTIPARKTNIDLSYSLGRGESLWSAHTPTQTLTHSLQLKVSKPCRHLTPFIFTLQNIKTCFIFITASYASDMSLWYSVVNLQQMHIFACHKKWSAYLQISNRSKHECLAVTFTDTWCIFLFCCFFPSS